MTIRVNTRFVLVAGLMSLLLISCAKQGSLSGGPKDLFAPKLEPEKSDKNFQTLYRPAIITLFFDEWIQLKNQSQILISPPLEFNPVIKSKGKRVEVIFNEKEKFRDSTTYSINFGNSIVDFTEANPVPNFQFVFSTGPVIDSLILNGLVIDAYTKKPVDKVSVMLYDQDIDSIVFNEKPYYFGTTDKNGKFSIRNLKKGRFKCFALKDEDFNFLFNQENEQIGFADTIIRIDTFKYGNEILLEMFLPDPEFRLKEYNIPIRGKLKIKANKSVDFFSVDSLNYSQYAWEMNADSIMIWYEPVVEGADSLNLIYTAEKGTDTLTIKSKSSAKQMGPVNFASFQNRKKVLLPEESLSVEFTQPISHIDSSFMRLRVKLPNKPKDSLTVDLPDTIDLSLPFSVKIDTISKRKIHILADWNRSEKYELTYFPGAINGFYGNTTDTLTTEISFEQKENLGNIFCQFDSLDPGKQYVVLLKQKDFLIRDKIINQSVSSLLKFSYLKAGKYHLEIIEDENRNGKWDPGVYLEKKQSERVLDVILEELRKNWDLETEIKWDSK